MTADDIIKEVRKQAYWLKARERSLNPKNFIVYLGRDEIYTLKISYDFLYEILDNPGEMRVLGMEMFEVLTNEPHIKVTN